MNSTSAIGNARAATLVVLNKAEASASLIDLELLKEVARVSTGDGPHETAVSPDGSRAVIGNYGGRGNPGRSLMTLDIASATITGTIDLGEYRRPHGMQWLGDGRRLVVTAEDNQAVLIVDVDEGAIAKAIPTGQEISHMVVLSPDRRRGYVANIGSGSITVIDVERGEKIADVVTGEGAEGIDVTRDGHRIWVTNRAEDTISIIDAETLQPVKKFESKSFPIRARVTPDGRHVLVTHARSGELAVFSTEDDRETHRIRMELAASETKGRLFGDHFGDSPVPIGILIEPDGRRAFVAHANADVISMIDLQNWKLCGSVVGGREPDGMDCSRVPVSAEARNVAS